MKNLLHPFVLTLVVGWLSVSAVAVKYVMAVNESDRPQPDPALTRVENPDKDLVRIERPQPEEPRLPAGLEWRSGEVLILIAATRLTDEEFVKLSEQIGYVRNNLAERLIGGDVFVVGRTRLSKWGTGSRDSHEAFSPSEAEFVRTFQKVDADLEAIRRKRGQPARTVVLWHSHSIPNSAPPGLVAIRQAEVIWSGKEDGEQKKCKTLDRVFGPKRITTHGAEIIGLAEAVKNALLRGGEQ